jgi:hypothetical protein
MIALIIIEEAYPCGNVFGVYETKELAMEDLNNKFPNQVTPRKIFFNNKMADLKFVEFELNTFVSGSLTQCAGCMSQLP